MDTLQIIIIGLFLLAAILCKEGVKEVAKNKRIKGKDDALAGMVSQLFPMLMGALEPKHTPTIKVHNAKAIAVKIKIPSDGISAGENFWVRDIDKDGFGIVDNELVMTDMHGFKMGDKINVKEYEIIDVAEIPSEVTPVEPAPEATPKMAT
ncbi:hypothetical protein OAU50_02160 [Planctomycetota bacterium]|nr:hypothetical protein [Planctomycetota bacterium]